MNTVIYTEGPIMLTELPEARAQNGEMDLSSDEQPIIFKCNLILKSEV